MFNTVLIANRGEIACRAIRTLKRLGVTSVAVYSDADRNAPHVTQADIAIALGGEKASESYLMIDKILAAAKETGAQAIYPGYGFLSESAEFADACEAAGIAFIGPTAGQIREFGLKHRARELAGAANVPMTPGTGLLASLDDAVKAAADIGYPVMLKSTAGGGGIGLTRCEDEDALRAAWDSVKRLGEQFFRDAGVFLERFVDRARHVEVQIFGDGKGREALHRAAVQLGESVNYRSGWQVRPFDFDFFEQLYDLRIVLELEAVKRLCALPPTVQPLQLAELKAFWIDQPPLEEGQVVSRYDEEFHMTLVAAAGNAEMARIHRELTEKIRIIRRLDFTKGERVNATYKEHAGILLAIIQQQTEEAQRQLHDHIAVSKAEVRKITLHMLHQARAESDAGNPS